MDAKNITAGSSLKKLRVVIAEDDRITLQSLCHHVESLGHKVVVGVCSGSDLIDAVRQYHPDLVITDIMLEELDGLSAIKEFSLDHHCAIIVVSCCEDGPTLELAGQYPVQAYIPKPVGRASLSAAIVIACKRFEELESLRAEVNTANRRLADRAIVEKAKGVLMKRAQITEDVAFEKMRAMARNTGQTMGQIANSLLLTDAALSGLQFEP